MSNGRRLEHVRRTLFGDSMGLGLFLGALCWFALTWQVGFFITDSYAVANTLVNVASGHLYIEQIEYSLTLGSSQPGLHIHDGRVFGRNYGAVYLALPLYLLLEGLSAVADLRVVASGGLSLAILGCAHQIGVVLERRKQATIVGSVLGAAVFLLSLSSATVLAPRWAGLLALQLMTALAGAAIGVVLYRLFRSMDGRRVGMAVGLTAVVASPVGFWATVPKRHVLTAALATVTVACFYVSRADNRRVSRQARASAYVAAGFAAAVHAGEGAVLLGLLVPLDLATAPSNSRRDLAVVAGGLLAGLTPFLLTNALISGNPLLAPRWLESFNGGTIGPGGTVQTAVSATVTTAGPATQFASATLAPVAGSIRWAAIPLQLVDAARAILERVVESVAVVTDTERLYHVFVRSGRIPGVRYRLNDNAVVELTMLESLPVGGALVVGATVALRQGRSKLSGPKETMTRVVRALRSQPARATDLLVVGYIGALTVAYLPRLPLFSQITVRYLLPTVPLWLYVLVRLPPVRAAVKEGWRGAVGGYLGGLTVGGVALVASVEVLGLALGEALQFHALVNLGLAGLTVLALAVGWLRDRPTYGGVALGVTAAATTVLLSLMGLSYFQWGPYLVSLSKRFSAFLGLL